jgi:hypothetical protein
MIAATEGLTAGRRAPASPDSEEARLDAAVSHNVASVSTPSTGVYCITTAASAGISSSSTVVIADIDANSLNGSKADARNPETGCSAGQFEVDTFQSTVSGTSVVDGFKAQPFSFLIP